MDSQDPYSPPKVALETETDQIAVEYIGFWLRVLAAFIDSLLLMALTLPLLVAIYGTAYFDSAGVILGPMEVLISYVLPAVAIIVFWVYKSATPGKMLIHAKIVDADTGEKPSTRQLIFRYLGYYLSSFALLLGFLWVAFDRRKQGWHDKIANTLVVRR